MAVLSGRTRLAGVMGWPVGHSRSPRLHGFWLERYGIDGAYVPLPVRPEHLGTALRGLLAAGFAGVNVTIPHKESVAAFCDTIDASARRAGAVNTLVFAEGRILGSNTDGAGFLANLRAHGVDPAAGPALILGAGGGARAVAAALLDCGVGVRFANHHRGRAEALAAALPGSGVLEWEARAAALADHALLVNATPLGMSGQPPLEIDLSRAPAALAVADLVYAPLETGLLAAARARGLRAVEGLGMLLHQAGDGFAAWFATRPEVDEALYRFVAADLIAPRAGPAGVPRCRSSA